MKTILFTIFFGFLISIFLDLPIVAQNTTDVNCSQYLTPPPNNPDGSGGEWYPYSKLSASLITVFGYPSSLNKSIFIDLVLVDRKWKLQINHYQTYNIFYLTTNQGSSFNLALDENTKTDQGNQINLILYTDLKVCSGSLIGGGCHLTRPNSVYGALNINVEIPDWDPNQLVSSICQGAKPIDISYFLVNTLKANPGAKIQNAHFFVDGLPLVGASFNPTLFSPGNHIITAQKTYCNSNSGWGTSGDYISPPYNITVTAPGIQFPNDQIFICDNAEPISLLASPTGGTWVDIRNANNLALSGNVFDPSKTPFGNYTIRYTYTDPSTGCTGFKDLSMVINKSPTISMVADTSILFNSSPVVLKGDRPATGTYSGLGVSGNVFNPNAAQICVNTISYTLKDPLTLCSTTQTRKIILIPIIGGALKICNNSSPYNLLQDVNPKGGVFSGPGVSGNNFDPKSLTEGDYSITYSIINNTGCTASNTRIISVLGAPQTPIISGVLTGCDGLSTTITASNISDQAIQYQWFKSGANIPFFQGNILNYTINGTETLTCNGLNEAGCISIPSASISIISNNPVGDFSVDNTQILSGGLVNFTTTAMGQSYQWDFGDGGSSNKGNTYHYYYMPGNFNIKLSITSSNGCVTRIIKNKYVTVDSVNTPPLIVKQPLGTGVDSSPIGFNIYPSPFKDHINLTFQLTQSSLINFEIYDLQGHQINIVTLPGKTGNNQFTIDLLGSIPSGVFYIVKITGNGINQVSKLLKL